MTRKREPMEMKETRQNGKVAQKMENGTLEKKTRYICHVRCVCCGFHHCVYDKMVVL